MSILALLAVAAAVEPMAGLELVPFSRADAVQVADGRQTGTGVGEFDGTVWPSMRAFGGAWVSERVGLTGTLGIARLTTTTWTGEAWQNRHVGVVRPGADMRFSLLKRSDDRPRPFIMAGLYGDLPSARNTSNAFSPEERDQARRDASVERARLGGMGGRAGMGVDLRVHRSVAVGFIWNVRYHRAVVRTTESTAVTGWLGSEAALTFALEWPKSKADREPSDASHRCGDEGCR